MPDSGYTALVNSHYTPEHLADTFDRVLQSWGLEDALLTPSQLAPLDQFHVGGEAATLALGALAGVDPTTRVLDIGGGFGGPARTLAATYGCSVVVLDLTEAYCEVGAMLTRRSGLSDHVVFQRGDALAIPFPDAAFDLVWTQHSSMNIADKQGMYAEVHRVLRPGGRLALFEIMARTATPLRFPVPWARDDTINFLCSPDDVHALLTNIGFRTLQWEDLTDTTVDATRAQNRPVTPQPGLHLVLGEDF
ncbi:MAG TPA: methyltransferase domain-containing protein, partial [Nitrolancea sp.]|nr:methyltransferase domain-containing protein [Nitrolancea sp.]